MNPIERSIEKVQAPTDTNRPVAPTCPQDYRTPQMFAVGSAVDLLQRDSTGHLKDGTGGWWVWGS